MFVEKAVPQSTEEEVQSPPEQNLPAPEQNLNEDVFGEPKAEEFSNDFPTEIEPENQIVVSETETAETEEVFAQKYSFGEDFASPDSLTQDLNSFANFEQAESVQESEEIPMESSENESEVSFETSEKQEDYADFQDSEVSFEAEDKTEVREDLAAEVEAEENQMNWAFSDEPEELQAEEVSVEVHDEAEMNVEMPEEMALETSFEETAEVSESSEVKENNFVETENEEWKNTSPDVFVGYSPELENSSTEMKAEQFSQAEEVEQSQFARETYKAEESYKVEETQQSEVEMVAESEAEMPTVTFSHSAVEKMLCPFCNSENEKQAFSCDSCQAVLTLTDLETLLNQNQAVREILEQSVESLQREHESYGLSAEQLAFLGIGHINLKNFRKGFMFLQEAVHQNPSNVVLDAQVNALAIRLAEMEKQQSIHDSMPKNCKILVVDDSPTVRKLIAGKLEKCGHEVICAVDGLDALEKLEKETPDLILLDITMPRMDGYQVCKEIRAKAETKEVPVVMISGKDGFFDKVRGRMAGTSGYITKPFGPETLMRTVETYLN
jgi:CheY-like chemotaxis protein